MAEARGKVVSFPPLHKVGVRWAGWADRGHGDGGHSLARGDHCPCHHKNPLTPHTQPCEQRPVRSLGEKLDDTSGTETRGKAT